ncbi:hypothetical protein [Thermofilum sp.]
MLAEGMRMVLIEILFALLTLYRISRFQRVSSKVLLMREDIA